jgi:hypothetical protein
MDTGASFPEIKPPVQVANHSLPYSAEVKKVELYLQSPTGFPDVVLNKAQGLFHIFIAINILQPTATTNFIILQFIIIQLKKLFIEHGEIKENKLSPGREIATRNSSSWRYLREF